MKNVKTIIAFFIIFIFCIALTGCKRKPSYYSKKQVDEYVKCVFGNEFTLVGQKEEIDNVEENTYIYEYIYENNEGLRFSVFSKTIHPYFDAYKTGLYEKKLSNNYIPSVFNKHQVEIDRMLNNASFGTEQHLYGMYLFLDSYTQIEEASEIIEKMDKVLQFKYDYSNNKFNDETMQSYIINIYLRPDYGDNKENWKEIGEKYKYNITDITISNQRLNKESIIHDIKHNLVLHNNRYNYYNLPDSF